MLALKNRIGVPTTIRKTKKEITRMTTPTPMTAREIVTAMDNTYQSCAHDIPGDWVGSSVLDFVVSVNGHYADDWDKDRYAATSTETADRAIIVFNRRYGFTE